jgi:phosphate transport system protein
MNGNAMKKFDNELYDLQNRMMDMAHISRSMFALSQAALRSPHRRVQVEVMALEESLDRAQIEIDQEVVRLMTVHSPVATDLRTLIVCMHVTSQLERIGDQVLNICESVALLESDLQRPAIADLISMADLVSEMLEGALDSFFERDVERARAVWSRDDLVDARNAQIIKKLLSDQVLKDVLTGTEDVADALAQILVARHLERIADQAVNICKEVVYLVEGHDVRHEQGS